MKSLRPLQPGQQITLISPGSWGTVDSLERARALLQELGYRVKISAQSFTQDGQFAGDNAARLAALHEAFADTETSAIICARGGYGSPRLLAGLDFDLIARNPKIFLGYSDITCLLNVLTQKAGFPTFHGPMGVDLTADNLTTLPQLFALLSGQSREIASYVPAPNTVLVEGRVEAPVYGGNLCLVESMMGTDFMPSFQNGIFLMEDIDEALYRLDRTLNHMTMAKTFDGVKGVIVGTMLGTDINPRPFGKTEPELFRDYFNTATINGPVILGAPFGHAKPNLVIPIGHPVTLSASETEISIRMTPGLFSR